jgi:16S rRNA (cytosine1402-N4)-methyltransferase
VNDESRALEQPLGFLPAALKPGGRVVVLAFHSGEDRRVK